MRCNDCGRTFEEAVLTETTYESYYGVSSEFPNSTRLTIYVCLYCRSDEIDEDEEYEEDEE